MEIVCKKTPQTESNIEVQTVEQDQEIIVCAFCNHYITDPSDQIQVNQTFRHIFANPHVKLKDPHVVPEPVLHFSVD